mmetsp:Transcript_258/g.538  ORF Transcript_258/g.538 Transcript_258/m.538 type:complete len:280 (-) Transcript_258:129-968(-)
MLRLTTTASLLLSTLAIAAIITQTNGDNAPISLDDIEEAKSARLMKNKEDIDVQSTFHEDDIKGTGDVPDEYAARLVKNRGPITAKITASGSHTRHCQDDKDDDNDCTPVRFSLVAWKFAGDAGTVHGEYREEYHDDGDNRDKNMLRVDVDCMVRNEDNTEAIVGGYVAEAPEDHIAGNEGESSEGQSRPRRRRRAYVRVVDAGDDGDSSDGGDYVSDVQFEDDGEDDSKCSAPGREGMLKAYGERKNGANDNARVSVCSKHGGWEECLAKGKAEPAIE